MAAKCVIFVCLMFVGCTIGVLPDYIHVCHRSDPDVAKCITQSVEVLRPRLRVGIPELEVPPVEPLHLPELVISRGTNSRFKAIGRNVLVYGLSNFQVTKLKLDIPNNTFYIGVKFAVLQFSADVDVNARILVLPIKGQGQMVANATNCLGNVILKAELIEDEGVKKMHFTSVDIDLQIDDINVHLENLFGDDPAIGDAVNSALYENRNQIFSVIKPIAESTVSELLLDLINKVVKNLAYDEVFPE